ncbi:MAG: DUF2950 family protein [Candidatus Acidiferrum sp.]
MNMNSSMKIKGWELALIGMLTLAAIALSLRPAIIGRAVSASGTDAQMTFQSPAEAARALDQAAKSGNANTLVAVLGGEAKALITIGDADTDRAAMQTFADKYQQMNRWVVMTDGSRVLYIGADNFAFPVPLAKNSSGQWYFDSVAGAEEVRTRDIGRNELLTIEACFSLSNAEDIYYASGGDSPEYAQRVVSTAGKKDGLYWPASEGAVPGPLAYLEELPKSSVGSLSPGQPLVLDGYVLRILTAQGDNAPGQAQNYIVNGKMTDGFAILATPVKYAETGIMTFMINREGVVYERDLGADTSEIAAAMREYDPNGNWSPVAQ